MALLIGLLTLFSRIINITPGNFGVQEAVTSLQQKGRGGVPQQKQKKKMKTKRRKRRRRREGGPLKSRKRQMMKREKTLKTMVMSSLGRRDTQ